MSETAVEIPVSGQGHDLRLASELRQARTPLDVLCGLTEHGATMGLGLWAMAMITSRGPSVWLCSIPPLVPPALNEQLARFLVHAGANLTRPGPGRPWADARVMAVCLRPEASPISGEVGECWDRSLRLCDETQAMVRAAAVGPGDTVPAPVWEQAQIMVRAATPYLRAAVVGASHDGGLLCPDSGVYAEPYFRDCLDREVERARRHLGELSLAVVELRPTNMSQEPGKPVHGRIGGHLRNVVRRTDLVGRLGLRSYGVFFYDTGPRLALLAAGRMADALSGDPLLTKEVSFAIGVSGWELAGADATSVLAQARTAATEALLIAPGKAFVYA
jgi:GGDEF domain-containing protein